MSIFLYVCTMSTFVSVYAYMCMCLHQYLHVCLPACVYICVCLYMCALCGDTEVRGEVYATPPPRANRPPRAGLPPQQCAWVLRREEASLASRVVLLETDDGDIGIFHQEKS